MLKLRRGTVVEAEPLTVEVGGERRPAWADAGLVGPVEAGDEVVVNIEARDLGLGSGGFDVVHVNLTRGLDGGGPGGRARDEAQLHVAAARGAAGGSPAGDARGRRAAGRPVLVIPLHGHLAPAAWAAAAGAARASGRVRAGRRAGRCRARSRATCRCCASAGCWAGTSPPGRVTAASTRRSAWRAGSTPRPHELGWDAVVMRARARGSSARPAGSGTAGWRRSTRAHAALGLGLPTLVLAAAVELGPAAAPPRAQPSHADGAGRCCSRRFACPCPRRRSRAGRCSRADAPEGGCAAGGARRPDRGRAAAATTSPSSASTSRATRPAACRRRRWAATHRRRTRCSSPPPLAAGRGAGRGPEAE